MPDYQLAIAHIEKLLDRRQTTTSFYLSVNTVIAAAIGLILKDSHLSGWWLIGALLLLISMGLIACAIWRSLLRQYQTLLGWWYGQLRKLEAALPDSAKLFTLEYNELIRHTPQHGPKVKIGLTQRELALNWVFTALYGVIGVAVVVASFWQ